MEEITRPNKDRESKKGELILKVIFSLLVFDFIAIVSVFIVPTDIRRATFPLLAIAGITFSPLGAVLIYVTKKQNVKGTLRKFLMLTGVSSAGFLISVFLHNIIYGLFIQLFGDDFWNRIGMGDEPLFFVIAIFICPLGFIIGVVGSIVVFIKKRRVKGAK